jgi:hypothetical protein
VNRTAIWTALNQELEQFGEVTVVHGGCRTGADDIADRWAWGANAMGHKVYIRTYLPDYGKHGDRATLIRNKKMAESGVDACYAFPLDGSRGTRNCMTHCFRAGVPIINKGFQSYTQQSRAFAEANR